MTIRQVDLVDYVAITAGITGIEAATIARLPNPSLAEPALHAPFAGFGEHEFAEIARSIAWEETSA